MSPTTQSGQNNKNTLTKHANPKPYVSVVIPTLNEEGFIAALLNDLITQDMKYEVIVSDSGSVDRTQEIVESFIKKYPQKNIRFIPAPIKGVSIARNNGAAFAKADYIIFLDADTRIPANFLRNAYLEVKRRGLAGAGCDPATDSEKILDKFAFKFNSHCILNVFQYTMKPFSAGAGIIVKRSIHQEIKGFDPKLNTCEDLDYIRKISNAGKFRMLKSTKIIFNTRRLEDEGRARVWFKYLVWGSCYLLNLKPVKFEYQFGKFNSDKFTNELSNKV